MKSKSAFAIIGLFILCSFPVKSQKSHAIVLDLAGIGGYGSLNYEHFFFTKNNYSISGKIGFSFYRLKDYERKFNPDILFPYKIQLSRKWKNHSAVFGIGNTISSIVQASENFDQKIRNFSLSGSLILGYKFQKINNPFFFQISYTPLFEHFKKYRNWGGISLGYLLF